jgi:hypothetical protein
MMHIVFMICAASAAEPCEVGLVSFVPRLPVACIHAAGPKLARAVPEGWHLTAWRCVAPGAALPPRWAGLAGAILTAAEGGARCEG